MFRILASFLLATFAAHSIAADSRPNFVFIIADDQAWDDSGAYGNPKVRGFEGWAADLGRAVVVVAWPVAVVVAFVVFARAMVRSDPESTIKRNPHGRA